MHFLTARMSRRVVASLVLAILAAIVLIATLAGCGRARDADSEYEETIAQIEQIQEHLDGQELYELGPEDLEWLEDEFIELAERVERMEELSSLPLGLNQVAEFGSARYRATMQMLEVAKLLAESGQIIANIGNEALTTLEDTGIRYDAADAGETWLEVIQRRDGELDEALILMEDALEKRRMIDESELPGRVRGNLASIDEMIARVEDQLELAEKRPLAYEALGGNGLRRYLVLFQNPTELRPTGGFVGTIAILELERGQIYRYDFQDVYEVSRAYDDATHVVEPPWGIAQFVRADKLQFQDANWWPNFPDTSQLLMEMADSAGWDELHGVTAVQPETIQDMITITGPISVLVDGEEREITSENLLEEAERQRRLEREGIGSETQHKEVIELIGDVLLDQLSLGDREDLIPAVFLMFDRLDLRDMQGYHVDQDVQAFLVERNWAGLIEPEIGTPTLSPILANVTGLKTSLAMQSSMHLDIQEPTSDDMVPVTMTLSLEHTGVEGGDPFYEGFQRYWVDLLLPDGSEVVSHEGRAARDPEASNGGAYVVNLEVGETQNIVVEFLMPAEDELLLRRQPGLVTSHVSIEQAGCRDPLEFWLYRDHKILLDSTCPEVDWSEFD